MNEFIPQYQPLYGYYEKEAICNYMENPGFITEYHKTKDFEGEINKFLGTKNCIVVNNGTISLSLALLALGAKPGNKVIVPNITMYATATAVSLIGCIPVFIDVTDEGLMDLVVLSYLLSKPDSELKFVIYVSLNGRWDRSGLLMEMVEKYRGVISFIEDAAQSFGSNNYRNRIGSDLDITSFSFSTPKIITTGQGGCLTTEDDKLALKLRQLKDFGRSPGNLDIHEGFGINSKFTELQAVLGLAQMKHIEYRVRRKQEIYNLYMEELEGLTQVKFLGLYPNLVPWFVDAIVYNREKLISFLKENNIGTRKMYSPITSQPFYMDFRSYQKSEDLSVNGLWLPSSFTLKNDDISYICRKVRDFYAR
jgi:perosamine synthetase